MFQYFQESHTSPAAENVSRTGGGDAELDSGLSGQNVAKQKDDGRVKKREFCDWQGGFWTTEEKIFTTRLMFPDSSV